MTTRRHLLRNGQPAGLLPQGPLGRLLTVIVGAVLLVAGLFFSVIAFAVILLLGLVAGGWLWWKTRALRRDLREQLARARAGGEPAVRTGWPGTPGSRGRRDSDDVIEGDFIREQPPTAPASPPASDSAPTGARPHPREPGP